MGRKTSPNDAEPNRMTQRLRALVPLKSLENSKGRLETVLGSERSDFARAMAQDVLACLVRSGCFEAVVAITGDADLQEMSRDVGAEYFDDLGHDLNGAVEYALAKSAQDGIDYCAVFHGDLPFLRPALIQSVVSECMGAVEKTGTNFVGLGPCKLRDGTNFLFLNPKVAFAPQFGLGSFDAHVEQLLTEQRPYHVFEDPALSFDVDTPKDFFKIQVPDHNLVHEDDSKTKAFLVNRVVSPAEIAQIGELLPLDHLMTHAARLRDEAHGLIVTYSRKVFIPLTHLCRDVCHYCVFAKSPRQVDSLFMSVEDVLEVARQGAAAGCHEALFTLGEKPELRYRAAQDWLTEKGFSTTLEYVAHVAEIVHRETGLLPHINAGCMNPEEILMLRKCAPSMGVMLENVSPRLCEKGQAHFGSPDKDPAVRLQTLEEAGKAQVPFTTGILIGIGETRAERLDSLYAIKDLHDKYGHIQEIIVQNFVPKEATKMAQTPAALQEDLQWTIAMARLIFGGKMSIQAPPNLAQGSLKELVDAGINDWGGVSPITPDHVNPESPWPHLAALETDTREADKHLVQRLTIYPEYALDADRWVDDALRPSVLQVMDGEGLAREDEWLSGVSIEVPAKYRSLLEKRKAASPLRLVASEPVESILDRPNETWTNDDVARLFAARGDDFQAVCAAADNMRRERIGDGVTYVINRNINYTNICTYGCTFCAFSKGPRKRRGGDSPYNLELREIVDIALEAEAKGATELCLQGGIHPTFTGQTYLDICAAIREEMPDIHIHAFSPLEVTHGAESLGLELEAFLSLLKQVGLNTLPGTAAEILTDEAREILCPDKINTSQWLNVIRAAHHVGLNTTSTIMFGHVDSYLDWAIHLRHLLDLQKETGGISEFVPLGFVAHEAPLYRKGLARRGPTFRESVLMHAVSRLMLDPHIQNIQTSWVKMGMDGARACLNAGANDLGGTLMSESITRAAGASHGQEMTPAKLEAAIRSLGREPHQRMTNYGPVRRGLWMERQMDEQMAFI